MARLMTRGIGNVIVAHLFNKLDGTVASTGLFGQHSDFEVCDPQHKSSKFECGGWRAVAGGHPYRQHPAT